MKQPTPEKLRLGTRQSALALAQSGQMARELERRHPGLSVELVRIVTRGDREKGELAAIGGKGLFTEELEAGLLDGSLDLAVHSLKDLPVRLPEGLRVAAFPARADARDVMVSEIASDLDGLPAGAILLTGSLRRRAQILHRRPDVVVESLRGNVDTRLRKWRQSGSAGVILAAAGLDRLQLEESPLAQELAEIPGHPLDPEVMVPAPGQGILAIEVLRNSRADEICAVLDDPAARRAALAERHLVTAFGGDCTLPLAAWARADEEGDSTLRITGVLATPDGRRTARGESRDANPQAAAQACVAAMREAGADDILRLLKES